MQGLDTWTLREADRRRSRVTHSLTSAPSERLHKGLPRSQALLRRSLTWSRGRASRCALRRDRDRGRDTLAPYARGIRVQPSKSSWRRGLQDLTLLAKPGE